MRIITKRTLREFWERHPNARASLEDWYRVARRSDWNTPDQVKIRYPSASIIADNRVVFNIKGNDYRLVVRINYRRRAVYIRFVGTHAEYDRINAVEI